MAEGRTLSVLVVDDEPLGCKRIVDLLKDEPDVELLGTAEDGEEAIDLIRSSRPDMVFLDIQMPGKTGLDVVHELGDRMPVTVFVTAYDQFAVRAFDVAAVDYLIKPFDNERFREAFRRARRKVELESIESVQAQIRTLLSTVSTGRPVELPAPPKPAPEYLERVTVRMKGKMRVIPLSQIDYFTASGPYVELHVGSDHHIIRESLQNLEARLDPAVFTRIHRSVIVRLGLIDSLLRAEGGDYEVRLRTGDRLKVSRYRRKALERRLGRAI